MTLRSGYAVLFFVGLACSVAAVVVWLMGTGGNLGALRAYATDGLVLFLLANVGLGVVATILFIATDGPKRRVPFCGWAIIVSLFLGVSAGLPLYLWLREKYRVRGRVRSG